MEDSEVGKCECVGELQYKKKTKIKEDVGRGWKDEMKEAEINTTKSRPLKVRYKREKGKTKSPEEKNKPIESAKKY